MNINSINSFKVMPGLRFGNTSAKQETELTDEEFKRISDMPDSEFKLLPKEIKKAWAQRIYDESLDESNSCR